MRRSNSTNGIALVLAACLVVSMLACRRGPAEDMLRDELQHELDVTFEEGLFAVQDFRRMGSASFTGEDDAPSGLHVYYDAVLELQRDYALTSWKGLNLGTLAFIVGATDEGISGIRARGNAAGDELRVHGRLSYAVVDGKWRRIDAPAPPATETEARPQQSVGLGPTGPRRRIAVLREF